MKIVLKLLTAPITLVLDLTTWIFIGLISCSSVLFGLASGIAAWLEAEIEKLLQADQEFTFLVGGMGQFDDMGASAARAAKCRHPEKHITLALVLPYMSSQLNTDKEYYQQSFDRIIILEKLDNAHYKAAIQIRNRWMQSPSRG